MATSVTFEVLYGGTAGGPVSGILRVDGLNILLDCGWDDHYDTSMLQPIEQIISQIDMVVISHPDPAHLGALPYLVGRLKLKVPIYATAPCHKMGQMFMYDQFLSRQQCSDFSAFSLDDVDAAFQSMRHVKFQQQVRLIGKGEGMSLTAFSAGHLLGGALWQLLTRGGEQIVYAVHWNHRKDRHLQRADLDGRFSRPAVLITDAGSALRPPLDAARRDQELASRVLRTLNAGGSVLIPCDTAGRSLELALLLEHVWRVQKIRFTIVLLTPVAYSTLEFAKSLLEWMNQDISDFFNKSRSNPFEFRHVQVCDSREKLWALPPGPKLVMASLPSLGAGMSLQLLVDWGPNPSNLIIFPALSGEGGTAEILHGKAKGSREAQQVRLQLGRRVALEGEELQQWRAAREAKQAGENPKVVQAPITMADTDPAYAAQAELVVQSRESPDSVHASQLQSTLPAAELHGRRMRQAVIDGFSVPEGAAEPMFPCEAEEDRTWTEYGATLKPDEFCRTGGAESALEPLDSMDVDEEEEIPTQVVSSEVLVNVRAEVESYDFEGLSDARSVQTLLANMAPRHLIIAYGSSEEKRSLFAACAAESQLQWEVHLGDPGRPVDASSGSSSFSVTLADHLMELLALKGTGNYHVAWLSAAFQRNTETDAPTLLLPTTTRAANNFEGGIFIGDVKLSGLRRALGDKGYSAEFSKGMLVCQSNVTIKADSASGKFLIEGPLSADFFGIRDVIYSQYLLC